MGSSVVSRAFVLHSSGVRRAFVPPRVDWCQAAPAATIVTREGCVSLSGPAYRAAWRALVAAAVLGAGLLVAVPAVPAGAQPTVPAPPPPAVDDQSVVLEVPGAGPTSPPTSVCPALTRADFSYAFADGGVPAGTQTIDGWTEPVRLGLDLPPVTVTVSLRPGVDLPVGGNCRYSFSLASYATEGPTPGTVGRRTPVGGPVTGVLGSGAPTLILTVAPPPCTGQVDLWAGTQRYDDGDVPPDVSVATWNGDRDCTGGGVVADLVAFGTPACPGSPLSWLVVNANGRAVQVDVVVEGGATPFSATLLAQPGATPVQADGAPAATAAITVTWRDDSGTERTIREPAAPDLVPGTPDHDRICLGVAPGLSVDKTADPPEGTTVPLGGRVTWIVTVGNESGTEARDLEIVDVVPAYASVVEAGGGEVSDDGRLIRWRVTVAPGERVVLTWSGDVATVVPGGVDLVNTALAPTFGLVDITRHPLAALSSPGATPPGQSPSATAGAGAGGGGQGPRGPLAFTGAGVTVLVGIGVAAAAAGGVMVAVSRRRGQARRRALAL